MHVKKEPCRRKADDPIRTKKDRRGVMAKFFAIAALILRAAKRLIKSAINPTAKEGSDGLE